MKSMAVAVDAEDIKRIELAGWAAAVKEANDEHLKDHEPDCDSCHTCAWLAGEYGREDLDL
jgi:hypothetical protein